MPGAADFLTAAGGIDQDVQDPVAYGGQWVVLVVVAIVALVVYYAAVTWWTRAPRSFGGGGIARRDVPDARRDHLQRLERIEHEARSGALVPRVAHLQVSETLRSYVAVVSSLPAASMTLADLRSHAPQELVEAIEMMYVPEFAPEDGRAGDQLGEALHRARRLVTRWS